MVFICRQILILNFVEAEVLNKKTLLIAFLLAISFLGLLLIFFIFSRRAPSPGKEKLAIVSVEPIPDSDALYDPTSMQITLIFNQPLSLKGFFYSLTPPVKITPTLSPDEREIVLRPKGLWPEGEFVLAVSGKTVSQAGVKLNQDYFYRFRVGIEPGGAD